MRAGLTEWAKAQMVDGGIEAVAMTYPLLKPKPIQLEAFSELLADAPEDERWELFDGRVIKMMVGARWEHARIVSNLHIGLGRRVQAMGSPCRLFAESFRVEIRGTEASSFLPDIIVACASLAPGATALKTPTVLMEVLSDDTAARDRGAKWEAYKTIETLQHYVLVERDKPEVEVFDRRAETWARRRLEGLETKLDMPAIGLKIPLAEIYADLFA